MKTVLSVCLLLTAAIYFADAPAVAGPPAESNMTSLFNGENLDGWNGDPRLWSVKDGVIHGETTPENPAKGNTFIIYKKGTFKDFELRFTYRLNATNNSGVQYRSQHIEKASNDWVVGGYQHEIRNEVNFPNVSGFIYSERGIAGKGRLCLCGEKAVRDADGEKKVLETLVTADEYKKLFKLDDWNDVIIVAKGNHIQHYLNGKLILDYTDNSPLALTDGIIALQLHAGKPMWTEFKNIRIKEL